MGKAKNKNIKPVLLFTTVIFALISIGLGIWVAILLINMPKNCAKYVEEAQKINHDVSGDLVWNTKAIKLFMDSDDFLSSSRYHFASDEALQGDDLTARSYLSKKMYLIDLAKSGTNEMVQEYDLESLFEPKLNEYRDSLPTIMHMNDGNEIKRDDATIIMVYSNPMSAMPEKYSNTDKYAQIQVNFTVGYRTDGANKPNVEVNLGNSSFVAVIDVPGHKIVNYAKVSN